MQPGQLTAFVGASGCGKSTLIALLERFYDPTSGSIKISSTDTSELSPRLYRQTVGLVQREPVLYQGSIRENIALGLESPATDEQISAACAQANILTFIQSLLEGFNTPCGSQGLQLSGGQRQRVTIARDLIRRPRLLLLDEATSALDRESEKIVQATLETARQHTTTVAVAHRLSTIKDVDVIYVLDGGRIVERGTHELLIRERGIYYTMCLAQSLD
jgi:ATP-binding cassette subfamily B (MDR/TAP) protein 1